MANTLRQSAVHAVFAPKYRQALIQPSFREPLERYMTGTLSGMGHQPIAIYAMPDHVHLLFAITMNMAPQRIMHALKGGSSKWINEQEFLQHTFRWQRGYGWFHVGGRALDTVVNYIRRQPEHHRQKPFLREYTELLNENGVAYDPEYLFLEPE
ncbi:IS200/IS605 family transposase [Flaviaesturariibacter flavus]|nr:IS200/IS605 family transposase [Flaviaesturariibacter flavus]